MSTQRSVSRRRRRKEPAQRLPFSYEKCFIIFWLIGTYFFIADRQEGVKYAKEIDAAHLKLTDYVLEFERYLANKQKLVTLMEQARVFYETQLAEAKIVETVPPYYVTFSDKKQYLCFW